MCARECGELGDTHLLPKIFSPVKVLLPWWQWGAGAVEGSLALEAEEVDEEEEEEDAAEVVEAKGPSPPSGCCCSSSGC